MKTRIITNGHKFKVQMWITYKKYCFFGPTLSRWKTYSWEEADQDGGFESFCKFYTKEDAERCERRLKLNYECKYNKWEPA